MKKVKATTFFIIMVIVFSMFTGCSSNKLADIYSEDEVIEKAKQVVEVINTLDYDAMNNGLREDLRDKLTAEQLKEAWDSQLQKAGEFKEYKATAAVGQKSKSTGEDYAAAVLTCEYENSDLTFTIMLDKNLDIVGMYLK